MPSAGRNAFSEEDDTLLLEYLAVFSTAEERKGNRVYKQLTDNISGHWPWSSRHPWQSWRHRYIREPDYFDRKIRNHLRHKRQAETLIGDQAPTSQVSEATSKESRPQKRKTSSVVENRKEEKRRRIEPDSLPQTKAPKKNTVSTKDTGPIKQRRKDKEESVVPNLDFVPISQFTRRAPILSEGKGEGPSRSRQPSRQFKAVLATDNSEFGSDADSSKHYSYLPSLSKDRNTLVPPRPNTTLPEKGGDSKKSPPHHSPPGSDDYMGELFGESSNSLEDEIAREMELDPEADQENDENEDLEVNHMLTDPMNTDTYMSQGKPA
ncbi:hypothetical protein GYMLUDRAFT_739292 [Collybiopsis luxurians FD-317 M1]|uniref:TERF2-interacting telomeric protein 1 Myb domain-containing protein n=1 Tax=Collybiopsis luxurians FD-317 M1 TaxID=944289 RepID=A0A0D0CHB2_9AGAR|nr:hypothetical protein GYMLUDRAFT_739292 [Collybiopsis luxurians FD-317 M1]